jgi:type I restriction enzyme S subunit
MSSEWRTGRLGEHTDACLGKMLDAQKNKGIPQPYLGNSNVRWGNFDLTDLAQMRFEAHEEERYSLAPGDLVVCEGGEPGRCAIWTGTPSIKIQKALHRIRPKAALNNYFLFYWFCHAAKTGLIEPYFTGTTIKHLSGRAVAALEVPLPPIQTQVAIAEVLKSLDDRITLLRETNATLEAIAQALFKSWFVDFDPVRAKLEGRAPEGMDEHTARLFPDSFEESELGLVPRGWRVESIYSVATLIYGAPFASKQFNSNHDGAPLIRIRDLRDEAPGVFTPEVHPKGYMVQPGDIVVGMDGEFRAYLWGGEPAWLNQRVCVFAPKAGCPAAFVHRTIMPLLAAVEASETATTVIHLGKNDIDRFRILVPDARVLAAFGKLTDGLYSKIVNSKQSARTLATLRDTLLPRLISGQLRLPEAQAAVEEALA